MKLTDLMPEWIKSGTDDGNFTEVATMAEADGIMFKCPKCFAEKGRLEGVHMVICWTPVVPPNISPKPGRWSFYGTSFDNLSLRAGSSSILLSGGCNAHFFITNGEIK